MFRYLPLFLWLLLLSPLAVAGSYRCQDANGYFVFSSKPCASTGADPETARPEPESDTRQNIPDRLIYTKDVAPLRTSDTATQACFSYMNTTARFADPSTTRLVSATKKWVPVKRVGSRQMVTIGVTSKNEAGMYVGVETFNCLLMGDNVTINAGEYELL